MEIYIESLKILVLQQFMEAYKNPVLLIAIIPTALWIAEKGTQGWPSSHAGCIILSVVLYPVTAVPLTERKKA